jgi:hypothetical protein
MYVLSSFTLTHFTTGEAMYGIIFLGFWSLFHCQRISPWKFRFSMTAQATE